MTSQWTDWLRLLAQAGEGGRDLVLPPITRGKSYLHVFEFYADVSAHAFAADLRVAPDADALPLVAFTVTVGTFDGEVTPVTLELTALQAAIEGAGDDDANGLAEAVFNLFHTPSGGEQNRIAGTTITIAE